MLCVAFSAFFTLVAAAPLVAGPPDESPVLATFAEAGIGSIVTEIAPLRVYHRAEEYHQDYRKKHPVGECGLRPTGVPYPATGDGG